MKLRRSTVVKPSLVSSERRFSTSLSVVHTKTFGISTECWKWSCVCVCVKSEEWQADVCIKKFVLQLPSVIVGCTDCSDMGGPLLSLAKHQVFVCVCVCVCVSYSQTRTQHAKPTWVCTASKGQNKVKNKVQKGKYQENKEWENRKRNEVEMWFKDSSPQNKKFCHHFLTFISFQTHLNFPFPLTMRRK